MSKNGHELLPFAKIQEIAKPHWDKLTGSKKQEFEKKANASLIVIAKIRRSLTFDGLELADYLTMKKSTELKLSEIRSEIVELIAKSNDLDELTFHFISTSNYVNANEIYPAEISMIKFNLKYGIHDEINILVKPGLFGIPPEHQTEAEYNAFKLRLDDSLIDETESDYFEILNEVLTFLLPLEKIPIFFAEDFKHENVLAETRKIFSHIFQQTQEDEIMSEIKIYPVNELFDLLRMVAIKQKWKNPQSTLFENVYSTPGCDTHTQKEASYACCLSKARRMCYTIAKNCCDVSRHDVKPGSHYPY